MFGYGGADLPLEIESLISWARGNEIISLDIFMILVGLLLEPTLTGFKIDY